MNILLIGRYLDGTTASGLYEARLGKEEMGKENHVLPPAYKDGYKRAGEICDHIIFNSFAQLRRHKDVVSGKAWDCVLTGMLHLRGSCNL